MKLYRIEGWRFQDVNPIPEFEARWFGTKAAASAYITENRWQGKPVIHPRTIPVLRKNLVEWLNRYDGYGDYE